MCRPIVRTATGNLRDSERRSRPWRRHRALRRLLRKKIAGWEVDRVVRDFIGRNGYAEHFVHRTGHSIGATIHANGVNLDDFEITDECEIIPNACFSVEPGIYMPDFDVRSEVNVLVRAQALLRSLAVFKASL
jgi:Xaa-Pro aminopeptidase